MKTQSRGKLQRSGNIGSKSAEFVEGSDSIKGKGKVTLFNVGSSFSYETGINGSRRCALYSPASVHRFTGIQRYGYTDQRIVETDVVVTEDRTGDLSH